MYPLSRMRALSAPYDWQDRPVGTVCSGRDQVYPFVYWAGVTTTLVWVAFSAYSALTGF